MAKLKAAKVKGLGKAEKEEEAEHILDDFLETLPDFCASVLFNGAQRGDEWVCSDLQNSPCEAEGLGSCNINLAKGVFHDHNPAADPEKGGMLDMWRAIFGVSKGDAIKGIKQWNKDRTLPDGSKGVVSGKKVELSEDSIIEAQDEYEESRVKMIHAFQTWIEDSEEHGGTPEKTKHYENLIDEMISQIFTRRWLQAVECTQAVREKFAGELAEMRGLSKEVFLWLIDSGNIACVYDRKEIKKAPFETEEGVWVEPEPEIIEHFNIAFPVCCDIPPGFEPRGWTVNEIELKGGGPGRHNMNDPAPTVLVLGMHIPWTDYKTGVKHWRYTPKGCPAHPYAIGDARTADLVIIAESTWDIIAYIDLRKLYTWKRPWCAVATRGARNAQRIPASQIKQGAVVLRLLQNDAANAAWVSSLPAIPQAEHREITPPDGIKDLNDWMKAGADNVLKAIW
jgi:hypothetical protein